MNQNDLMRFLMANGLNPQSGALAQPQQPGILAKATQALNEPLPMEGRLTFLPARVTPHGKELALPGILASAWNAFTAPGRAYSGNMADPVGEAMNVAGMMNLGAMPSPAVGGPGTLGMNVYHGSPHKFDKFDMRKVGTGEGNQAYGHGLYFAENPAVAKQYVEDLGRRVPAFNGVPVKDSVESMAHDILSKYEPTVAKKVVDSYVDGGVFKGTNAEAMRQRLYQTIDRFSSAKPGVANTGSLYKVDLPDDQIAKMLDWDKPLSQQPEAVKKLVDDLLVGTNYSKPRTGRDAYDFIGMRTRSKYGLPEGKAMGENPAASMALKELGIPGIRYLDGGSRSGGKGTSNFVVFDDKLPKIIGRE